ncbi:Hypothetical predicted protein [Paramuricea clavata]|uniref:Uncharacterized protein n=1 Tax=Paramuricea clavata TaxID=317549 RepID=A0A7D9HLT6_PARCT|nr:Hypothetical predicted protein [Paramuricea clavata]
MTNEAPVVVDGESTVDMPEKHGTNNVDSSDDEQESCENTIHYNLMPEQEDDLQLSMLNNTSVDTVSTTAVSSYIFMVEECTQVANEANNVQVTQGSSSANKEQWNTKLGSTLAYILGNTDDVIEFDRARKNAKNQRQDKFLLDNYMHKLAII